MKKLLITIVALAFSEFAFAQKIIIDRRVDDFTGVESTLTYTSSVDFNLSTACCVNKVGESFQLSVACRVPDMYEIEDKGQISFKFKTGKILTLYSTAYQCAVYTNYWLNNVYVEYYSLSPFYNLPEEDLSLLQVNDIVKVRIYVKSGEIDFDINSRKSGKLKKMFNLFDISTSNK